MWVNEPEQDTRFTHWVSSHWTGNLNTGRYSSENLNEINGLFPEYETLSISIEAENSF
ncbi:MAG: hypothetical protein M3Z92_03145 [Bacteroidota bacterium]|nr:hypothetical protein [Bacteroidota bacterium]